MEDLNPIKALHVAILAIGAPIVVLIHGPDQTVLLGAMLAGVIVLSIAAHEVGHAVVGLFLGFRVREICVGRGSHFFGFKLGQCVIRIRVNIFRGGYCKIVTSNRPFFRLRSAAVSLAGVGGEVVFVLFCMVLRSQFEWAIFLPNLAGMCLLFSALGNLIPARFALPGEESKSHENDGMAVLQTLKMADQEIDSLVANANSVHASIDFAEAVETRDFNELLPISQRNVRDDPDGVDANHQLAMALIFAGQFADALKYARKAEHLLVAEYPDNQDHLAIFSNTVAYIMALIGDPAMLTEAKARAEHAYHVTGNPVVGSTLGAVLVQTNNPTKGIELLKAARPVIKAAADLFETERFLLIGYLGTKNVFMARNAYQRAMAVAGIPDHRLQSLTARLGAAEAAFWSNRARHGELPSSTDLGPTAPVVVLALSEWMSESLPNDERWRLFAQAGGDPSAFGSEDWAVLINFKNSLQPLAEMATQ